MKTEPTEALKLLSETKLNPIHEIPRYRADIIARIAFSEGQSNPKIKQLEWLDDTFPHRGYSVFVDYLISKKIGSYYTVILDIGTGIRINSFKTIEEAKAAAQADFEKRVMECLDYD